MVEILLHDIPSQLYKNETVIGYGTVVKILSTRCDFIPECWNGIDEVGCGFESTSKIALIGKQKQLYSNILG